MKKIYFKELIKGMMLTGMLLCGGMLMPARVQAVDTTSYLKLKEFKKDMTPTEPANSDLQVVQKTTKLSEKRWIQSYTKDNYYYYFIQMTHGLEGHLRITRVKYRGFGLYNKDYMTLRNFGHGTNLDCSVYNGKTYLWTGSNSKSGNDVSMAVTYFPFRKNAVLTKSGKRSYQIPLGKNGKYVKNVYPAINENSTKLAVRFLFNGKQHFQVYQLKNGTLINTRNPLHCVTMAATPGTFQGFDIYGNKIYTIEGSPSKRFLKKYDRSRKYYATKIRTYNILSKKKTSYKVKGASKLSFREPEGIKVKNNNIEIMFVSHILTDQSCNLYRLKKKL